MNKLTKKILTGVLCLTLCLSGTAGVAYALNSEDENEQEPVVETAVAESTEEKEISKDETVYVISGTDGTTNKIIVSDWIRNALSDDSISDKTGLTGIENVKGDETFAVGGDSMTVWDAQGNDIYYMGNIEKELPVGLSISYTLDGKSVSADEIAGKSGKVKIRFGYENRQFETAEIDGNTEKIYVPFVVLTGMLLDTDTFRNVEVSNGKMNNDGDHTAVIGFALPGLAENLGLTEDIVDIPDYFEITADVTDFEFGMTLTVATNELFNSIDYSGFDSVEGLKGSIGELTDGMQQLLDGSSALYDGLSTLLDKSDELVTGIGQLADGTEAIKTGSASLSNGAAQLSTGASDLSTGLNTLKSSNETLNNGATQIFETLLYTAETQISAAGVPIPSLTIQNYAEVLTGVITMIGEESEGAQSIIALKASLDSYNAFYTGLGTYTAGVASAADGASALATGAANLKDGASQLKDGAATLYDGITQLKDSTPALTTGVSQLKDGAMQLNGGLEQFNEDGIQKIVDLIDGDIENVASRLKATLDVSKGYRNFSGISDEMSGQVKFIYRTEEISAK